MKKTIFLFLIIFWADSALAGKIVGESYTYTQTELVGKFTGQCDAYINNYQFEYYSQPSQVLEIAENTKCNLKISYYNLKVKSGYDAKGNYVREILSKKPINLARLTLLAEYESGQENCNESYNCNVLVTSSKTKPNGSSNIVFPWSNRILQYQLRARKKGSTSVDYFYIKTLESGE